MMTDNEFQRKYEFAFAEANDIISNQTAALASYVRTQSGKGRPVVVFNTLSYQCELPTEVKVRFEEGYAKEVILHTASGEAIPIQLSAVNRYADGSIESANLHFVADVPSMGLNTYYLNPSDTDSAGPRHTASIDLWITIFIRLISLTEEFDKFGTSL